MKASLNVTVSLFILGSDYHLGDLLWFTAVLAAYRREMEPSRVIVSLPDRPISRVLEQNPLIDELALGTADGARDEAVRRYGKSIVVHDLRVVPIAFQMVRQWQRRRPWLYYSDLWAQPRGQWLATFLGLGRLYQLRPTLRLTDDDRTLSQSLPERYVVFAPHIGRYSVPLAGAMWRRVKGWPATNWVALAGEMRRAGFEPFTLGAAGQESVPGTTALLGLPIRQVAGVVERASAMVTVESGLWFVAAALGVPFVIVPWWLPRSIDWPGPIGVPHARVFRNADSVAEVAGHVRGLMTYHAA
jgi:hypothetical protein